MEIQRNSRILNHLQKSFVLYSLLYENTQGIILLSLLLLGGKWIYVILLVPFMSLSVSDVIYLLSLRHLIAKPTFINNVADLKKKMQVASQSAVDIC